MSIEKPTAQELHMADQIGMMLEEVEKYASPGLEGNDAAREKLAEVLDQHRLAVSRGPKFDGGSHLGATENLSVLPKVPGLDTPVPRPPFNRHNPEHLLAPIVIPAWDLSYPVVVRDGITVSDVLRERLLPEDTDLDRSHCYWHDGPGRGGKRSRHPKLLTQTSGQYVVVWWACPYCTERLKAELGDVRVYDVNLWVDTPHLPA